MKAILLMRLPILLFFIIVAQTASVSAQDKGFTPDLNHIREKGDTTQIKSRNMTGIEVGSSFSTNLKGGYGFDNYVSPHFSFQSSKSWQFDVNTILGTLNYHNMSFLNSNRQFNTLTGNSNYFGLYGQGTYKVNDKLYFGTSVYIDKMLDNFQMMNGLQNKTNYTGSMFVGYKFSDKVSIQAGVSVQHYESPWDINNSWLNH
jgi:hypothetical protein